jgi:hypothetical protein
MAQRQNGTTAHWRNGSTAKIKIYIIQNIIIISDKY